ncbi:hypothetical protein SteCoe_37577 [Stentor coeruleus]|uniref:Ion transport domain-containing protein n=1 Tax=Stentor coeruleus TaxID=5963 RepID=A0A1R2AN05_9CILI|nr:hypothetical protein SteCoe_37577 [Stentor coeruleus]
MEDSIVNTCSTQPSYAPNTLHPPKSLLSPESQKIENLFSSISTQTNPPCETLYTQFIISTMCISYDENYLITGTNSGGIYIWKFTDLKEHYQAWTDSTSNINIIKCNPEKIIYAGNDAGEILIWDFEKSRRNTYRKDKYGVTALEFLEDKKFIIASKNTLLELWHEKKGKIYAVGGHDDVITCMRIDESKKIIYTGSSDYSIKVWDIDEDTIEETRSIDEAHKAGIVVLELYNENLISGDLDGEILIWNLKYFEQKNRISLMEELRCLAISSDNRYLFTATENSEKIHIKIWNLNNLSEDKPFAIKNAHTGTVNGILYMPMTGKLITVGQEKAVKVWNFSKILSEELGLKKNGITAMSFSQYLLIYAKNSRIKFITSGDYKKYRSLNTVNGIKMIASDAQNSILAHDSPENTLYIWRLKLYSEPYCKFPHPEALTSIVFFDTNKILTGCTDGIARVWNLVYQRIEYEFPKTISITSVKCSNKYAYIANQDGVISIWKKKNFVFKKNVEYKALVMTIDITDTDILVAGGQGSIIKFWRWKNMVYKDKPEELLGHKKDIFKIIVIKNLTYSASYDKTIKIWSINLKMLYYSISLDSDITDFYLSDNCENIHFYSTSGFLHIKNPLKSDEILVHPQKYSWIYLKYLQKLFKNKTKVFDEYWKNYIIFPHLVNLLYILIKANHPDLLKQAIASGVKFLQDQHGESPLSVSLNWRNYNCADVILKSLSKLKLNKEPGLVESIESSITKIINSNLSKLPIFFESLFSVMTNRLTLYAQMKEKAPMILESKARKIVEVNFNNYEGDKKEQVEFKSSIVRFDFTLGSQESIQLLRAISHSNNPDFFRTALLKSILKYKWKKVYFILLGEALIYGFMVFIVSYMTIGGYDGFGIFVFGGFNTIMLVKEEIQFVENPKKYAKDVWNFIDLLRILLSYVFLVYQNNGRGSVIMDQALTILYWARAVTYFRIFDKTRYLIRMIIETFIDVIPFLLIFFTATFTFTLLFYITKSSDSLAQTFVDTYKLNFNDFSGILDENWERGNLSAIFWAIFFIASIINPIVLLNMLIAIMSDTYDRVQEDQVVADCKEMAVMMMQAEAMLFWRRGYGKRSYLQRCDYVRHLTSETTEWMGKIRAIKKSIARLNLKVRGNEKKIYTIQKKIMIKIKELKGINEHMSKKITDLEGVNNSNKSSNSFIYKFLITIICN